ncbi:hypothetical protein BP5796_06309 [Coleophoma crateriformis]|uniref:Uncharacterized protein n=1 Tax=Coleophoma crateriformis TaxID=565419 RepID=A0A3D8RWN2_9HELO|nr:hypothetical protein BP5796_06309 [Coleophoma crateriformis]
MSSQSPIPVILCGQQAEIARSVQAALLPEYEELTTNQTSPPSTVIHVILSASVGTTQIPGLLSDAHHPGTPPDAAQVGTQNYSQKPQAVICGAAYDEKIVDGMRRACDAPGRSPSEGVPWLMADLNVKRPPIEEVGRQAYGEYMTQRVKTCLGKLVGEDKLGKGDCVVLY